jgi:iron complex outermembrane receptor protein
MELAANLYAMEFRNEIAPTGELSELGSALRRNVDRSYRRGIELDASWQVLPSVRLKTNANFSRNRIAEWTQFVEGRALLYRNVEPLLSPSVIVNQAVDFTPNARFSTGAVGRYVGRSYLDNTNSDFTDAPAYFVLDANASYAVTDWARVTLQVNNVLDDDGIRPSGYSYLYFTGEELSGIPYYYPHATRNAVVLLDFTF